MLLDSALLVLLGLAALVREADKCTAHALEASRGLRGFRACRIDELDAGM
jgi:hypothetical protein